MRRFGVLCVGLVLVAGCATISDQPTGGALAGGLVAQDLQDASANFDGAIAIGVLPADDPAAGCLKRVIADLGIGGPEPKSFEVKRSGLISEASIVYIRAKQARAGLGSVEVSTECKALLGQFIIDNAKAFRRLRGLIPGF